MITLKGAAKTKKNKQQLNKKDWKKNEEIDQMEMCSFH